VQPVEEDEPEREAPIKQDAFLATFCAYLATTGHVEGIQYLGSCGIEGIDEGPLGDCPICATGPGDLERAAAAAAQMAATAAAAAAAADQGGAAAPAAAAADAADQGGAAAPAAAAADAADQGGAAAPAAAAADAAADAADQGGAAAPAAAAADAADLGGAAAPAAAADQGGADAPAAVTDQGINAVHTALAALAVWTGITAVMVDAIVKPRHNASAGRATRDIKGFASCYFGEPDRKVHQLYAAGELDLKSFIQAGPDDFDDEELACTTSLHCSRPEANAGQEKFDRHGIVGGVCSHNVPLRGCFMDMPTPEQFVYYLLLLVQLATGTAGAVKHVYIDFACRLGKTWERYLRAQGGTFPSDVLAQCQNIVPLVNWMHGASHNRECQLKCGGRYHKHAGRKVGENAEQLWSMCKVRIDISTRAHTHTHTHTHACAWCVSPVALILDCCCSQPMAALVKYMTHGHRLDVIENTLSTIAVDKVPLQPDLLKSRYQRVCALVPDYEKAERELAVRAATDGVADIQVARETFITAHATDAPGVDKPDDVEVGHTRACTRSHTYTRIRTCTRTRIRAHAHAGEVWRETWQQ
jgi:hypothetical protein